MTTADSNAIVYYSFWSIVVTFGSIAFFVAVGLLVSFLATVVRYLSAVSVSLENIRRELSESKKRDVSDMTP